MRWLRIPDDPLFGLVLSIVSLTLSMLSLGIGIGLFLS